MSEATRGARLLGAVWLGLAAAALLLASRPGSETELGNYVTPLDGRSDGQRHNARLAAAAIDGAVIAPGEEFSFNRRVGPWTRGRGYRPAPVSYGGEMVVADGGGVCQVSTTLYAAALGAGLTVVERDHHLWLPHYAPPGRDAAVAQGVADLRLTNPFAAPVRITAGITDDRLTVRLWSTQRPLVEQRIEAETVAVTSGPPLVRFDRHLATAVQQRVRPGRAGCRVRVWRSTWRDGRMLHRELVSDDEYQALSAVTHVGG